MALKLETESQKENLENQIRELKDKFEKVQINLERNKEFCKNLKQEFDKIQSEISNKESTISEITKDYLNQYKEFTELAKVNYQKSEKIKSLKNKK